MTSLHDLPQNVLRMIESGVVANFATMTKELVPIDTPTYYFPSDDMTTIDVATGVPNPAKAERARRNSKVGILIEGRTDEPVVVIRAHAAVRDSDIQANAIRYLAETGYKGISHGITWEKARQAITYWSRIIIENKPQRVYWWDSLAALDGAPGVWEADPDTHWPTSDPPPAGKIGPGNWTARRWQDVARDAMSVGHTTHLTVVDENGFPAPMRVKSLERTDSGFRLAMPLGTPWALTGKASLTFAGYRTFVGEVAVVDDTVLLRVDRALPQHPSTLNTKEVLQPAETTLAKTRSRLVYEMERRGQELPVIPEEPPERTRLAQLRIARIESDSPITGLTVEHGNRMT